MSHLLRTMLRLISPSLRRRFVWVEVLALVSAIVDAMAFVLLYPLMRLFTSYDTSKDWRPIRLIENVLQTTNRGAIELRLGIIIVALFILSSVIGLTLTTRQCRLSSDIERDISFYMFERYMGMPYLDHIAMNSAEMVRNTHVIPIELASNGFLAFLQLTQNILVVLFLLVIIALASPIVVLVALVYFGIGIYGYIRFITPKARSAGTDAVEASGSCLKNIQEGFSGMKAFRSANAVGAVVREYDERRTGYAGLRYRLLLYSQIPQYYLQSIMIGGVVLVAGAIAIIRPPNPAAIVGVALAAFIRLMPSLYILLNSFSRLRGSEGNIEELRAEMERFLLRNRRRGLSLRTSERGEREEAGEQGVTDRLVWHDAITLRDVKFQYPGADRPALDRVSTSIGRGEFVGIVGPSGAGKTTIVDLLLGLFTAGEGGLYIDDRVLDRRAIEGWRRCVGYVPQDVFLIDGSVAENVALGIDPKVVDEGKIWIALERAQLVEEVRQLPGQLQARLGERGVNLSGGQRQRIGIARALFTDPEVLILDEATSSLDIATEAAVTETVEQLGSQLTRIVVAHRLSTVRRCDRLLLLQGGRLVAEGDFVSLREGNRYFQEMAALPRID